MHVFADFIVKLIPIYVLIGAGYVIGKRLPVKKEAISSLLIYLVAPVVIFNSVYTTKLSKQTILLPLIFFVLCSTIALFAYFVANRNVKPSTLRGMLSFAAGSGNTGYFGLPVALALFGEDSVALVVLCIFGYLIYETTVGFLLIAKDDHTLKESIYKLLKLPILYGFLLGVVLQLTGFTLGSVYANFVPNFRGAYVLLGSLLVGIALSELRKRNADIATIVRSFVPKFIVWPLVVIGLILLDKNHTHLFLGRDDVYRVAFLMSIVPIAANTVAYATFLKAEPERAAFIVFTSTIFAIIYIPLMTSFVLPMVV